MDKTVKLTIEEWDRLMEILNDSSHPDKYILLKKIHNQVVILPADQPIP